MTLAGGRRPRASIFPREGGGRVGFPRIGAAASGFPGGVAEAATPEGCLGLFWVSEGPWASLDDPAWASLVFRGLLRGLFRCPGIPGRAPGSRRSLRATLGPGRGRGCALGSPVPYL